MAPTRRMKARVARAASSIIDVIAQMAAALDAAYMASEATSYRPFWRRVVRRPLALRRRRATGLADGIEHGRKAGSFVYLRRASLDARSALMPKAARQVDGAAKHFALPTSCSLRSPSACTLPALPSADKLAHFGDVALYQPPASQMAEESEMTHLSENRRVASSALNALRLARPWCRHGVRRVAATGRCAPRGARLLLAPITRNQSRAEAREERNVAMPAKMTASLARGAQQRGGAVSAIGAARSFAL